MNLLSHRKKLQTEEKGFQMCQRLLQLQNRALVTLCSLGLWMQGNFTHTTHIHQGTQTPRKEGCSVFSDNPRIRLNPLVSDKLFMQFDISKNGTHSSGLSSKEDPPCSRVRPSHALSPSERLSRV